MAPFMSLLFPVSMTICTGVCWQAGLCCWASSLWEGADVLLGVVAAVEELALFTGW